MDIAIAILLGLLSAMDGISFKIASIGKAHPIQPSAVLSVFALLAFCILGRHEWAVITLPVALWSLVFGMTQYLTLLFFNAALRLGPLSPAWCAMSLNFMLVIVYSSCFLDETMSPYQKLSLCSTVCAILAAAFSVGGGKKSASLKQRLLYDIILIAVLLCCGLLNVGLKYYSANRFPASEKSITDCCGNLIMMFVYLGICLPSAIHLTVKRAWRWNPHVAIGSAMLSVGSITTYWLIITCISEIPTVTLFATSNTVGLLATCLISVFFMHENKTWSWAFTLCLSLLAIVLNQ